MRKPKDEILYQLLYSGKNKLIYVASDGNVYTRFRSQRKLTPLKKFQLRNSIYVRFNGRNRTLKVLVAKAFLSKQYHDGDFLECIDGNIWNCSVSNLRVVPRSKHFATLQNQRMSKPVRVLNVQTGETVVYQSIKDASEALHYNKSYVAKALRGDIALPEGLRNKYRIEPATLNHNAL